MCAGPRQAANAAPFSSAEPISEALQRSKKKIGPVADLVDPTEDAGGSKRTVSPPPKSPSECRTKRRGVHPVREAAGSAHEKIGAKMIKMHVAARLRRAARLHRCSCSLLISRRRYSSPQHSKSFFHILATIYLVNCLPTTFRPREPSFGEGFTEKTSRLTAGLFYRNPSGRQP